MSCVSSEFSPMSVVPDHCFAYRRTPIQAVAEQGTPLPVHASMFAVGSQSIEALKADIFGQRWSLIMVLCALETASHLRKLRAHEIRAFKI